MGRMQRRVAQLEGVARTEARRQPRWDMELLDDDELAELEVLARKAEKANRVEETLVWSPDEEAALTRLSAKINRDGGIAASARA